MANMKKTIIDHSIRKKLGITCNQYVFLDFISGQKHLTPTLDDFSKLLFFTEQEVRDTFTSLKGSDLITYSEKGIFVTQVWEAYFDNSNFLTDVIRYFNRRTNSQLSVTTKSYHVFINARLREFEYTLDDFKLVIDSKAKEWMGTEQEKYVRPDTLFGGKFEGYLNHARKEKDKEINNTPKMIM